VSRSAEALSRAAARYGVPLVILVFYVTALRYLGHTPEATYGGLLAVEGYWTLPAGGATGTAASPLWILLLRLAGMAGLDPLLGARALSLVFGSLCLLLQFLLAHEVSRDRLAALSVTVAAGGLLWLGPVAAGGSPVTLGLLLFLTAVLFQLRNEYPLAALFSGLSALTAGVYSFLLPLLLVDALLNSVDRRRGMHVAAGAAVVWAAVVVPWVLFVLARGVSPFVAIPPWAPLPSPGTAVTALALFLVVLGGAGLVDLARAHGPGRKAALLLAPGFLVAVLLLAGAAVGTGTELPAMFVLLAFSALAVRVLLERRARSMLVPGAAAAVAAVVLLVHQMEAHRHTTPAALASGAAAEDAAVVAGWIRGGNAAGRTLEADRPLLLAYRTGRSVLPRGEGGADAVIVAEGDPPEGARLLFRPPPVSGSGGGVRGSSVAVWERGSPATR
jgi:hypothetical protein